MRVTKRLFLSATTLALFSSTAFADLIRIPYADTVRSYDYQINEIFNFYNIQEEDRDRIKRSVSEEIFSGPCKGAVIDKGGNSIQKLQNIISSDPTIKVSDLRNVDGLKDVYSAQNAIFSTLILSSNLGRQPWEHLCRYAAENSFGNVDINMKVKFCFSELEAGEPAEKCVSLYD